MSSETEKVFKEVTIDAGEGEQILVKVKYYGTPVGERLLTVSRLDWKPMTGQHDLEFHIRKLLNF